MFYWLQTMQLCHRNVILLGNIQIITLRYDVKRSKMHQNAITLLASGICLVQTPTSPVNVLLPYPSALPIFLNGLSVGLLNIFIPRLRIVVHEP